MGNSIYAVIDTNVIVSALISQKPQSYPLSVLSHVYSGKIIPVLNDEILAEYRNVLSRPKFNLDPVDIDTALHVIDQYGLHLERTPLCEEIFPDPKDIVFYEVKMSKGGSFSRRAVCHHAQRNGRVDRKNHTDKRLMRFNPGMNQEERCSL